MPEVKSCRKKFDEVQAEIDDQLDEFDEKEYESFENTYLDIMSKINRLILNSGESSISANKVQHNNDNLNNINLPKISLPKFEGSYTNWMSFKDTYVSLIHNNKRLTNVEKFHYLKASLSGEAAKLIDSLELTEQYYDIAFQTVIDRYDNKKQIIKNHTRALLNLPTACKSNIRDILDTIQKNIRALEACKQPVKHWSTLLNAIITNKFDFKLNEDWESHTADIELPTSDELIAFLTKKSKIAEAMNESKPFVANKINKTFNLKIDKPKKSFVISNANQFKCIMCDLDHFVRNCNKFIKLSPQERFEFIKAKKLCINCLRDGHKVSSCTSSNCKSCGAKHNSLLHFPVEGKSKIESVSADKSPIVNDATTETKVMPSTSLHTSLHAQIFLATASVLVVDDAGKSHSCRALLDSGSQIL